MTRLVFSQLCGLLIFGAVAVRSASLPDIAESQKARELNNIGSLYFKNGDVTRAEAMFSRAASLGEPDAALNLATILRNEGRYAEAEESARRALELREQGVQGDGHNVAEILTTLNLLGMLATSQGHATDAVAYLQRALSAAERDPTVNQGTLVDVLVNLGNAERARGDLGDAQAHLERALKLSQVEESVRTAAALSALSLTARQRGDFKEARTLGTRALQILRAAAGPDYPDYAAALSNLAMIDQDLRDDRKARNLLVGKRNPAGVQLALWTANLASLYSREHRYAEALDRFRSATVTLYTTDRSDMRTAAILHEYAALLRAAGSFAEAQDAETKALGIQVKFVLVNPENAHAAGL